MNQNFYSNGAVPQSNPSYPMAGLQGSTYAPPLNYNQPTEVVGGYDAKINPMTGEEMGQTNFAGGGQVNPEAGVASLLASRGRNGDSMLVHMAPEEVKGLQSLALAHGGSLTVNPDTGLYEASFLKKLLPTLLGLGLSFIPGVGPLAAAGLVGAGETLRTGDLGKGLMAGLGAFGGAGLGAGLSGAAAAGGQSALTGVTSNAAANQAAIEAARTAGATQSALTGVTSRAAANQAAIESARQAAGSAVKQGAFANMGEGVKALGSQFGREGFMSAIPGGKAGLAAAGMGLANAATPEYEQPDLSKTIDRSYYESYGYSPEEGRFLGGQWRTGYPDFPGYAGGGDVRDPNLDPGGATLPAPVSSVSQPGVAPSAISQYQSAPPDSASFAAYLQDLNKYVASPVPAPQSKTPPPATTPPTRTGPPDRTDPRDRTGPPGNRRFDDFDGVDFSGIDFGNFMGGGMNGLAGIMGNNFRGNDSRMQWDPDIGSFTQPGMNRPQPPAPVYQPPEQPSIPPSYDQFDFSGVDFSGNDLGVDQNIYQPQVVDEDSMGGLPGIARRGKAYYAGGGVQYAAAGKLLRGPGDGMSDDIEANISGKQEARLADGEFVIPADVVSHLGNGSSEAGARKLYKMMSQIRKARTGRSKQAPAVNVDKYLPK